MASGTDADGQPPADGQASDGGRGGGGRGVSRANPLTDAFRASTEWSALYDTRLAELKESLIASGKLTASLDAWVATLTAGASDLVSDETIAAEADAIRKYAE